MNDWEWTISQSQAVDGDAFDAQVKQKLDTLRKARSDAKTKLVKAQEDLKELVTSRQEAVLVQMGVFGIVRGRAPRPCGFTFRPLEPCSRDCPYILRSSMAWM